MRRTLGVHAKNPVATRICAGRILSKRLIGLNNRPASEAAQLDRRTVDPADVGRLAVSKTVFRAANGAPHKKHLILVEGARTIRPVPDVNSVSHNPPKPPPLVDFPRNRQVPLFFCPRPGPSRACGPAGCCRSAQETSRPHSRVVSSLSGQGRGRPPDHARRRWSSSPLCPWTKRQYGVAQPDAGARGQVAA